MNQKLNRVLLRATKLLAVLAVLFACLIPCRQAAAATEAQMDDYARLAVQLVADAGGTPLPGYVENGQSVFFRLRLSEFNSRELVSYLKENSPVDLIVDLDFSAQIEGSYPTELYPADFDNVAEHDGKALFRWWIEGGKIHLRFDDAWVASAGPNTVLEAAELGFAGVLNVQNKPEDGKVVFHAAGTDFPLQFRTGYALTKNASAPMYRNGQYEVDYTVAFTLDQDMNITGNAGAERYSAKLTLRDVIAANGSALTGEVIGAPVLTGPVTGLTASAQIYGTANHFTIGGASVLKKGTYTLAYTMKVDPDAAQAKLSGYDKVNTVELLENDASLKVNGETRPLTAQASIAWNNELSNRFKVDKCIVNQHKHSIVYRAGSDYYVDYYVVAYLRDEFTTFTVTDRIISNAVHTDKLPVTLLGANTAEDFWSKAAVSGLPELQQVNATVIAPLDGSDRNITLTAEDGEILPPGAYYFKVPVRVTDTVKSLSEAAQLKVGDNATWDATAQIKNKAILDAVDGDTGINETTKEVTGTIYGPDSFIKRGAIEMDSSGNYIIYDKEGVRGKLIRWDVTFGWGVPNENTVITDTMKGGQMLLVNGSTSFDIWDMTDGTESLAKLWNKNGTDYIEFGKDAAGNETFTFYPGRMSSDPQDSTRKFKLTYYTLVPEETYDFTPMGNDWKVKYEDTVPGSGVGPVTGEEWPQLGESVKLDLLKRWRYIVNDYVTEWLIEIKNPSKIPFDSLTKMIIVDRVRSTTAGGNQFDDGEVWIDHDRMLSDLPLEIDVYAQNGKHERLILGEHFTIRRTHPDYALGENGRQGFVIEFNVPAVKELMKKHNAKHFASIGITCYVHNADRGTTGKKWNVTNDAWLDYSVAGMEVPDEDATAYVTREYGNVSKTVGATVNNQQVIYKDYDGDGDKEVRWELSVGANEFKTHPDPMTITVTDTLPAEMTLDGIAGDGWKTAFHLWAKNDSTNSVVIDLTDLQFGASFSYNEAANTFTLSFVKPGGDWAIKMGGKGTWASTDIGIRYHTVFREEALQKALDKAESAAVVVTVPLTNSASVAWNGNTGGNATSTGDAVVGDIVLDKQAKWMASAGNKVAYTIDINPYGLILSEDGVLLLQDVMGDGKAAFHYLTDTFRLYNTETGARLAPGSSVSENSYVLQFAGDGKSFTLDVPDNMPLRLTYQVKTTKPVGTKDVTLQNTASLEGRTISPVEITFDVNSSYQSGSFSVEDDEVGIRIFKIDSRDENKSAPAGLSGAKFSVTTLDAAGQPVGEPVEYSTDADGFITILEKINVARIVRIREIQAPEGYMLDEEPWEWCYVLVPYGMAVSDSELAGLAEAAGCNVTVITAGTYAEEVVMNDPFAVSIIKKNRQGEALYDAEFTLKDANGSRMLPDADSMAGTIKFSGLKPGSYTLTETKAPEGYVLGEECSWTFNVTADGAVTLPADAGYTLLSLDGGRLTVVNDVDEPPVVTTQFSGSKVLTGKVLGAGEYSFVLADENGAPIETVQNDADGAITFTEISYTLADVGEHTYTVYEVNDGKAGVTYDATVYTVTVTVEDAGDGTLTVTPSANATALNFANTYAADGSVQFSGSKTLAGRALGAGEYSFVLIGENGTPIETVQNDADGAITFSEISYTLADVGEHTYTVHEVNDSKPGVTYDETVYTVTVTVADAGDGTLTVTPSANATALNFANIYAADGSVQFSGSKTLTGKALSAGEYSFVLADENGTPIETVQNDVDGKFVFSTIAYTLADVGEHTYTVHEVNDGKAGVTYDATVYNVTVTVADAGDGTLTVTPSANATALNFANTYAADGTVQFSGSKTLTGKVLGAGEYSFVLTDADGKPIETVQNDADGKFTFAEIAYTLADVGEHTYMVYEVNDGKAGVTYDETVYTVTVMVADAGDGTLTVTPSANATALNFANTYEADGSVQFSGSKTLTGKVLGAGEYSFVLADENGALIETVQNDADGAITFSEISYTLADVGEHTYTVHEVNDSKPGVTCDETVYTVTVMVEDAGDGTLTVTPSANATALNFVNTYEADGSVQFGGSKTLTGRALTEGMFSFELVDIKGRVLETVTNAADGSFTFPALRYTVADAGKTYEYTVREVRWGIEDVTYDTTNYTVVVTITDNGDGTLTVRKSANADSIVFRNAVKSTPTPTPTPTPTSTPTPEVTATPTPTPTPEVTATPTPTPTPEVTATPTPTPTPEVTATPTPTPTPEVTVTPTPTPTPEVTATPTPTPDVTATPTPTPTPEVTATPTPTPTPTVTATPTPTPTPTPIPPMETEVILRARKTVNGVAAAEDEVFSFVLEDEAGEVLQTVQNDGGEIAFAALLFDQDDIGKTFVYTIRETTPSVGTMTSDPSVYTVGVTVVSNGDGTLTASAAVTLAGEEVSGITFNNIVEAPLTISKKVTGCETAETFAFRVSFYYADGTEVTEPVAYTGDLTGEVLSGRLVHLGHGQSITFKGLLPGMRYTVEEYANAAFYTTVNSLPMNRVDGVCEASGNHADFVNRLVTTSFAVRKSWQGEDGGVIQLTLYGNGEKLDPQPGYTRDGDTYLYTGLPMYDADGELIVYAAKEKYMDGYLTIYDNIPPYDGESDMIYDGGTIINRSVTSIRVRKLWSGLPEGVEPPEVVLTLYCNGKPMDRKQPRPDADGWYVYKNLPRYVDGTEPLYYVVEEAMSGFAPVYTDVNGQPAEWAGDGYTITNCLIPATGDNNPVMLWAAMLMASSAVLLMLWRRRKAK